MDNTLTNHDAFLEAVLNVPHRVYGKKLLPLSLFHLSLLEKFQNPLLVGGSLTLRNVQEAALVCSSLDFADFQRKSKSWSNYFLFLFDKEKEHAKWEAYWTDYMSFPESVENDSQGKSNPFPFPLMFLCSCLKKGSIKDWEYIFYKMPVGLISWLNSAGSYIETGETNVMGEADKEAVRLLKMTKQ